MNKITFAAALALAATPLAHATEGSTAAKPSAATAAAVSKSTATASKSAAVVAKAAAVSKKTTAKEDAVIEKFVKQQDAAISTFLKLGSTLRGVKDKESADAAAPQVKQLGDALYSIVSSVKELGEPSEAVQQAIMSRMANVAEKNEMAEQVMLPLVTLMMQNPPCYGSTALNAELNNLLANLQGAAEESVEAEDDMELEPTPTTPATLQEPDSDEVQY